MNRIILILFAICAGINYAIDYNVATFLMYYPKLQDDVISDITETIMNFFVALFATK